MVGERSGFVQLIARVYIHFLGVAYLHGGTRAPCVNARVAMRGADFNGLMFFRLDRRLTYLLNAVKYLPWGGEVTLE